MLQNYFKIAFRNIFRNKKYFLINVLGFSFGITTCLLIFTYIYQEAFGFDNEIGDKHRIYRVISTSVIEDKESVYPFTLGDFGAEALEKINGIEKMFRVHTYSNIELKYETYKSSALLIQYVDSTFFEVLDFPLSVGDSKNALKTPFSAVLSKETALKIFGDKDPYFKIVKIDGKDYTIKGIVDTDKFKSHFEFDVLTSMSSLIRPDYNIIESEGIHFPTYIKLYEGVNVENVNVQLNKLIDNIVKEKFSEYGIDLNTYLQPLNKIHLYSDFNPDYAITTNIKYISLFTILAIFILLIAIINFINLSIALYNKRTKEVGIRKVNGARRTDLITQFVTESVLITFIAFIFSLIFVEILSNPFRNLMQSDIQLIYYKNPLVLILLFVAIIFIGFLSGIYPAFNLSGLKTISTLKGVRKFKKHNLRKVLVVFQFGISIFMIIVLLLLSSQMKYLKNKDMNFDRSNIIVIKDLTEKVNEDYPIIKNELEQIPGIVKATASVSVPGINRVSNDFIYVKGEDSNSGILFNINNIHFDYTKTYGIKFAQGRDFSEEFNSESTGYIINETAAKKLALKEPVGTIINVREQEGEIIGVVKDFNFRSLHEPISPVLLYMRHNYYNFISFKISGEEGLVIEKLKQKFKEIDPDYIFDYFYLDESLKNMYKDEDRTYELFTYAAILAIIISLLGLFALTLFNMQENVKAIGIRKVMGASNKSIVIALLKELTKWVFISNVIAWPVAFYFIKTWLHKFAYSIDIYEYWWCFIVATAVTLIISIIVVINQSLKAANTNPVDSLKYE
ncbi:MAG: FtsX-like permease family protein [Bacteroidales bacterium]|nr:FtsX-like permease family protein [Bacteroidales bacterium]